jgi:ABC-type nitrate/sulfonate/bicarbonate transport system permease component
MSARGSAHFRIVAIQALVAAGVIAALFLASRFYSFLPSPWAVLDATARLVVGTDLYRHLGVTFYESLAGLLIATVVGVALGVSTGASRAATEFLNPIILALYSVPKIIFLPVLLMIFGVGLPPKIANATLHAFFPIVLNTLVGMREVSRVHLKVARSMQATRSQIVFKVFLPSMVLPVFAGVRLGLGLSVMGALLAELFEANAGVGYVVHQFYTKGMIAHMIAMVIALFVLILAINAAMKHVEDRLSRWRGA